MLPFASSHNFYIYLQATFLFWGGKSQNLRIKSRNKMSQNCKRNGLKFLVLIKVNLKGVFPLDLWYSKLLCHAMHFTCCYDFSMIMVFLKKFICKIKKAAVLWIIFLLIQYIPTFVYWLFKCPKCFFIWLWLFVLT